jgi:hypothetical protein
VIGISHILAKRRLAKIGPITVERIVAMVREFEAATEPT